MLISSIVTAKIAYALAKDMVNFEAAKRLAPNLIDTSKRWLWDIVQTQRQSHNSQQSEGTSDEEDRINQDSVSTEYLVHNWLEALFAWFQIVVLWHDPSVSLGAVSGLLSSFLLLTYFAPRFYASIFIIIFVFNLYKFWFRHVWPEIRVPPGKERENELRLDVDRWTYLHPQLMTLAELNQHARNLVELVERYLCDLLELRRRKPVAFCSLLCSIFLCTAFIGNNLSGMSLVFSTLTIIMVGPGIYARLLPEDFKQYLRRNAGDILFGAIEDSASNNEISDGQPVVGKQELLSKQILAGSSSRMPKELIASSISSTTRTIEHLFETLRRKSSSSNQTDLKATSDLGTDEKDDCNEQTKLIDIPLSSSAGRRLTSESRTNDAPRDSYNSNRRRNSDSSYGNEESVSLIESDDDQQDGFVML